MPKPSGSARMPRKGVFAPDYILDTTLKQLASVRDKAPETSGPATDLAAKLKAAGLPPERGLAVAALMRERVFPALDRQRALVTELRSKATHDAGVWRLPDGDAYYAAAAEAATTVEMTGDEIHRLGLAQVAEIGARIDGILKTQGMTQGSVGERLVALNKRPDQLYPNTDTGREALLAQLNAQIAAMDEAAARAVRDPAQGAGRGAPRAADDPGRRAGRLLPERLARWFATGDLLYQPARHVRPARNSAWRR